jgi:integrase
MPARLEKTRTPGIFKRGSRYVFSYRLDGKQRWESCRTLDEARRAKAARATDIERGEFEQRSRITLHEYAREWIVRYQGRGRRGFRENTREEYSRILDQYVLRYFSQRTRLADITPSHIAGFVAWLCDETKQRRLLSDQTVRNLVVPLRACLATAVREGLLRTNPSREIDLPHRPTAEDMEDDAVKAMSREELSTLLDHFPAKWRLFFWFLAATGLRISEAVALQWRHVEFDPESPHVKVRRALVKGRMGPPKTRYARREVPIDADLADALCAARDASAWRGENDPVFPSLVGSCLDQQKVRNRVLFPARKKAGLPWVGFHAFRHTCATMLFAEGRNAVQVQRWLGHHSAAFTLATYVHLLDGDLGAPLTLGAYSSRATAHTR